MKRIHEVKIDTPEYYDEKIWAQEVNTRPYYDTVRMQALIEKVKDGDRVIDLGAGCFGAAQFLAEKTQVRAYINAVDYSRVARELVTERVRLVQPHYFHSFQYFTEDVLHTGFKAAAAEVVIAGEVIEHIENPPDLVKEIARICKPGGWMVISTVDNSCADAIAHGDYPEHLWAWEDDIDGLVSMFAPYGKPRYYLVGDYHFVETQRS